MSQLASCTRHIDHQCCIAQESGFEHKPITLIHQKAQGQVGVLNKMVNKTTSIAIQEDHIDPHKMAQAYRSKPHPAMGMTPCRLLMNPDIRSKLDHFPTEIHSKDQLVRGHDSIYKQKYKDYHDKRHNARAHALKTGNNLVLKNRNRRAKP